MRDPEPSFLGSTLGGRKLRAAFKKHHEAQTASVTIGALEPITSHVMADLGYDTVYVSGAACSHTDTPTAEFGAECVLPFLPSCPPPLLLPS